MNEVIIDGIKYVPENTGIQEKSIRTVLKSQGYLSASAIDSIMNQLRPSRNAPLRVKPSKKPSKKGGPYSKKFQYNTLHKTLFNISGILSNGSVLYRKGKSPVKWNIQQAILIRKCMKKDSTENMTYEDVKDIEKKVKLSTNLIRKIMYNIEHGDLVKYIEDWERKTLQSSSKRQRPVQNNPQKRRDEFETYR